MTSESPRPPVKSEVVHGKRVEVHEDRHGHRRYWAKIDGLAMFQTGRMRLRTFATMEGAWAAALEEVGSCE